MSFALALSEDTGWEEEAGRLIDGLKKGDCLTVTVLENLFGAKKGTDIYGLSLLRFKGWADRRLSAADKEFVLHCKEGRLNVCTDVEADAYTRAAFGRAIGATKRAVRSRKKINHSNLSIEERRNARDYDRGIQIIASQMNSGLKQLGTKNVPRLSDDGKGD